MTDRAATNGAICFYAARFVFGGWFLFHGLNYWLHYFPEPSFLPGAHGFIPELVRLHIFDIVKALEVIIGLALLLDFFAPLAIAAAVPISLVIAQVNFAKGNTFGFAVGSIVLLVNAVMAVGHLDRYLPMLALRGGAPGLQGARAMLRGENAPAPGRSRLPPSTHFALIVLGILIPALLTWWSIVSRANPR